MNSELPGKLAAGVSALFPSCKEAARLQSVAMARPLSLPERLGLGLHLLICTWCRRFGEQVKFLHSAINKVPGAQHTDLVHSLSTEARARIERRLRANAE